MTTTSKGKRWIEVSWMGGIVASMVASVVGIAMAQPVFNSTKLNFFTPGTQANSFGPTSTNEPLANPQSCSFCHGSYAYEAPSNNWAHTMMAQSGRDPVFHAALAIAEQDAAFAAESCMRCHMPTAWLQGKVKFQTNPASPAYGRSLTLTGADLNGIACSICHRMVDPERPTTSTPNARELADQQIIDAISPQTPGYPAVLVNPHNGSMVMDPLDRRRGPFDLDADWTTPDNPFGWPGFHEYLQSPFHRDSRMCATCHDVSTAHFTKQSNGSYALNASNALPAPSKLDQFPEQRTYSEWSKSSFAVAPMSLPAFTPMGSTTPEQRFGGNQALVASCQDCHMPAIHGQGCALDPPIRPDVPLHQFIGVNSWVLRAVAALYPDSETSMNAPGIDAAIARNIDMLDRASDLQVSASGTILNARIINYSGHKLPTGYTEGRRMWVNVVFKDSGGNVIAERGAYNTATATLTENDTTVFEAKLGPDATLAQQLGLAAGPAFRLALSNKIYKDNRIPPIGFNNAQFTSVQAGSVPANLYADGQYWADVTYAIPQSARSAQVRVYHQTTSREYIEFLRDGNVIDTRGQIAYDQWVAQGKSAPVLMDDKTITLACRCDWDRNGSIEVADIFAFLSSWFTGQADFDNDSVTGVPDIFAFLSCWFASCAGY